MFYTEFNIKSNVPHDAWKSLEALYSIHRSSLLRSHFAKPTRTRIAHTAT
jgi:hypothetical protein